MERKWVWGENGGGKCGKGSGHGEGSGYGRCVMRNG